MTKHTEIKELGEFGLIKHLTQNFPPQNKSSLKGVGDDCAVIDNGDKVTVISSDMLVHNIHFDLMYTPIMHLGYKSIVVGISDIYAMNAKAEQVVVSIAISSQFSVELIEDLYKGMYAACEHYGVDLVGGDTTTIDNGLVINITAIGSAKKEKLAYRNGAQKNEILCVSGDLGGAYAGLLVLEREKQVFMSDAEMQPILDGYDYLLQRILRPEARKDIVELFESLDLQPTSMMDISDGLSSEILHIAEQSNIGCKLFEEKIPIDPLTYNTARQLNLDPTLCALNGGEDYELLFTIKLDDFKKIENNPDITAIGHITDADYGCKLITKSGSEVELKAQGWQVFGKD